MLTKEALLALPPLIIGFDADGTEDAYELSVAKEFNLANPADFLILYACGRNPGGEDGGGALVFGFDTKKNQFFENYGTHCSCYGLERCWSPEYFETMELLSDYLARFTGVDYSEGQLSLIEFLKQNGLEV